MNIPAPSNRSPPATFKSAKATRGDLLEGPGIYIYICVCDIVFSSLSLSLSSCFNEGYVSDDGHAIFGHDQWVQLGLEAIVCKSIGINIYIYIIQISTQQI